MLYGAPIPVTIPASVTTTPQLLGGHHAAVRGNHLNCVLANMDAHRQMPFPANFPDLPDPLLQQVVAALIREKNQRRQRKNKEPMNEREEARFLPAAADKKRWAYRAMASQTGLQAQKLLEDQGQIPFHEYYRVLAVVLREHPAAHCGEYAAFAVDWLISRRGISRNRFRILKGPLGDDNNHACVVLDAGHPANVGDPSTYSATAMLCDPWLDLVAAPQEYFRILGVLACPFRPDRLAGLDEDARN